MGALTFLTGSSTRWRQFSTRIVYYHELADVFYKIENDASRDGSIQLLSNFFKKVQQEQPKALLPSVYLSSSELAPVYEAKELFFRHNSFAPCVATVYQLPLDAVVAEYQKLGDYGNVLKSLAQLKKESPKLTIDDVFRGLYDMTEIKGMGSVAKKQSIAMELLRQCYSTPELMYLARLIAHQRLRIGLGQRSILAALATSFTPKETKVPESIQAVQNLFALQPNYSKVVEILQQMGPVDSSDAMLEYLNQFIKPECGIPIQSMSGYPVREMDQVVKTMKGFGSGNVSSEFKYDGERIQLHISDTQAFKRGDGSVLRAYSRNSEEIHSNYLEPLMKALQVAMKPDITSIIVEGEVVAIDPVSKNLLPFQTLQLNANTHVCLFVFDLLLKNGKSFVNESYKTRRNELHASIEPVEDVVECSKYMDFDPDENLSKVTAFFQRSIEANCEGLMLKCLNENSGYKAGQRTRMWLKLKHDYVVRDASEERNDGIFLPDTLDLVPIGANWGRGRRQGLFGSFLMATYDAATNRYQTIGKLGSGFSDKQLQELTKQLQSSVLPNVESSIKQYDIYVGKQTIPDVWLAPKHVWEVRAAQLSASPIYKAASGRNLPNIEPGVGVALRFPRFVRIRLDKRPDQATETEQLVDMFTLSRKS